jgi:ABC-2 type transport system ATP-binding protein
MEQVEEICQHVVLINKGKKILDGTVNEIRQNHKENIFSIELDNTDHISDNPLFQIIRQSGNHIQLSINNPSESNQVLKYFIDNGKQILSFHEILPSLNEIFIRLVEEKSATRKFESTT